MNPEDAVELGREALRTCLLLGGPIIVLGLLVGLGIGLLQAMTQVQDQTVSVVPKILVMFIGIGLALPWLSQQMIDYTKTSFESPLVHTTNVENYFPTRPPLRDPSSQPLDLDAYEKPDAWASQPAMPRLDQQTSMPGMRTPPSSMPRMSLPTTPSYPRVAENPESDF